MRETGEGGQGVGRMEGNKNKEADIESGDKNENKTKKERDRGKKGRWVEERVID